jgi:dihydroorotate dehydrogenase
MDGETAQRVSLDAATKGWTPIDGSYDDEVLESKVFGMVFQNPIGLAAGFDKGGEAIEGMLNVGFGFVEVGTVTPKAQPGNDRPRMWRLQEDSAMIHRCGGNSEGLVVVQKRVVDYMRRRTAHAEDMHRLGAVGVNVGQNTDGNAKADFVRGVATMSPYADYIVINVPLPSATGEGASRHSHREQLSELVLACVQARDALPWGSDIKRSKPPLLLKFTPDMPDSDIADLCAVALGAQVNGLIVSDSTLDRPVYLRSPSKDEGGGLSGKPLFKKSTDVLKQVYSHVGGEIPIMGGGGVASGQDAYEKIRAGASLVQVYSSLALQGPRVVRDIKADLARLLHKEGFESVSEAVGADAPKAASSGPA